jgi:Ca-activated chloride channel homolog
MVFEKSRTGPPPMSLESAYPYFLYCGLPLILLTAYWRWYYYKKPIYRYSSLRPFAALGRTRDHSKVPLFLLRLLSLGALCFALARFRAPDEHSKLPVEGIPIMVVLDVSGSMLSVDEVSDPRSRIDVARDEAIQFIQKRENDPIGLVIFARGVVSRAPLTMDKSILKEILQDTAIGVIDHEGTELSKAIVAAANKLKNVPAKSKIMIVLTDGQPSETDIDPHYAIDLAKKLEIKIYTVGIGSDDPRVRYDPMSGMIFLASRFNIQLLKAFAQETGGQFFHARNAQDMKTIYETIDSLEKTVHQAPVFARYFEYFMLFLWITCALFAAELILRSFVWRSL